MSTGNLSLDILLSELKEIQNPNSPDVIADIRKALPSISEEDAVKVAQMCIGASNDAEKVSASLVATVPTYFSTKAFHTSIVVEKMIREAKKSISLTGYSLSEYFSELVDCIIEKSQSGVYVRFYANDIAGKTEYEKLLRYRGSFLKIYNYRKPDESMAALHAKVIVVDQQKTLITSANLSYHGQEGNIEVGALIDNADYAKQVEQLFSQLTLNKVFSEFKLGENIDNKS